MPRLGPWLGAALPALAAAFLVFIAGSLVTVAGLFPADHVENAYRAGLALYSKATRQGDRFSTDLWRPASRTERGLARAEAERAQPGLTLYASGHGPFALLVDLEGNLRHQWHKPYSEVWEEGAPVTDPVADTQVHFRRAQLLPDGDLIVVYEGVGDSPYGYGLARLDADSRVVWKNLAHFHHDFAVAEDGRIIALTHDYRPQALPGADQFEPPFLEDRLVVVSEEGHILHEISLPEAILESSFRRMLWRIPYYSLEDPLHANAVELLDEASARELARKLPMARPGHVLVSFRELAGGSIALIDPDSGEVLWVSRGPWLAQHDPDVLPSGNLLVFDNRGHFGPEGMSRVLEVDPSTGGIVWSYPGDADTPLESGIRASQQRLANGNTLITESDGGRLVEVTAAGDIVWEYINPVRAGEGGGLLPVVTWGQRVDPAGLERAFRARLEPGNLQEEVTLP